MNPDASRFLAGAGAGGRARHERSGRACLPDSARPPRAGPGAALLGRSRWRNRPAPGRSNCRRSRVYGSGRIGKAGLAPWRSHLGSRTDVDETRAGWNTAPACVPGTVWGAALKPSLAVEIERPPAFNPGRVLACSAVLCQPSQRRLARSSACPSVLGCQTVAPRHALHGCGAAARV